MNGTFAAWLKRESCGDVDRAVEIMRSILGTGMTGAAEEVWEALDATGDNTYSDNTFKKAAKQLLETQHEQTSNHSRG